MSYKIAMTSSDLDKQRMLLTRSDRFLDRHFAEAMTEAVDLTYSTVRPNIPRGLSGQAQQDFEKGVFGFGKTLTGAVGWWGDVDAWYINIVEHGARKHSLAPVKGSSQKQRARREESLQEKLDKGKIIKGAHVYIQGKWVTMSVHKGFSKRGFMEAGFSKVKPLVDKKFQEGAERALKAMEVK